jgi:hypothetical protein
MKKYINFFICEHENEKYFAEDMDTLCRLETDSQNAKLKTVPEGKVFYFD